VTPDAFRPGQPQHRATASAPGTGFPYTIADYARAAAKILGDGWHAEAGFLSAFGVLYKGGEPALRLWVNAEMEEHAGLCLARVGEQNRRNWYGLCLPGDAPATPEALRSVAEHIADQVLHICAKESTR
jgi:hypothetical protein